MSRINTNVSALISTRILNDNNASMNKSLEKLSTGLRINRGSDDPAGLIASENIRKQIAGTETGIKNANRAINVVGTAEGGLSEISDMLIEVQSLLGEAANSGGMSQDEIDANQQQVDSILNSIDRIANSTEFEGMKLLNGNKAYTASATTANAARVSDQTINAAKLIDGATMAVTVDITTSAHNGVVRISGDGGAVKVSGTGGADGGSITLQIGSSRGTTQLTFADQTAFTAMSTAINAVTEITGVSAKISGGELTLHSVDFGSDAYVSVEVLNETLTGTTALDFVGGSALSTGSSLKDYGQDAVANINGTAATADGKKLTIRTAMLDAEIELTAAAAQQTAADYVFNITGGGADFSIGSSVDAIGLESLGIQDVSSASLGDSNGKINTLKSGGANALSGTNLYTAQRIVDASIKDISKLRGRLGSFQKNTLEKTINSLTITNENLYAAESAIRDTDFASETAKLTRSQILVQSSTNVLAQANQAPQNVLSLL
ncbi:MAG: flagellin [Phycisphaerae bacterium]|nr:flagellin [Phycisphaerae bacterium]